MSVTEAQRRLLIRMAKASEDQIFTVAETDPFVAAGLITVVECSDGDYFEFTPEGRAALSREGGE